MDAISALQKEFDAKRKTHESIEIEWPTINKQGIKVFVNSFNSSFRVNKVFTARQKLGDMHFFVECILQFCLDEEGNRLFKPKDKSILMEKVDNQEIMKVGGVVSLIVFGDDEEDIDLKTDKAVAVKN